jgi:hypothetical protein
LLVVAGLLLYFGGRWGGDANSQIGIQRDRHAGPERTHDDRQQHTITLVVSYRPARQLQITWGIGEDGGRESRYRNDRPRWEQTRTKLRHGTLVNLGVDNFDEGGYLNCEIRQDGVLMRHFNNEHTTHRDSCDLYFVVGGKPEID